MEVKSALALPGGLEVTGIEVIDEVLTITAVSTQRAPRCPLCGVPAARVHSRDTRQFVDLPCGRLGVRVADRLNIQTSGMRILRRILALETSPAGPVSQIGIDDFSFRRGRKFGTIVVDLQTHEVLDVLASSDGRHFSRLDGSPPGARHRE